MRYIRIVGFSVSISIAAVMIFSSICSAYLVASLDVKCLLPRSSLVVKGEVKKMREGGITKIHNVNYRYITASFRVDRIIKGNNLVGKNIEIEFLKQTEGILMSPSETLAKGEYCIVFLTRKGDNFEFTDPDNSKIPALRGKVKVKLQRHDSEGILAEELINNSFSEKREIATVSITQLGNLGMQEAIPYLRKLENAKDPTVRKRSFDVRIKLGDSSCIREEKQ